MVVVLVLRQGRALRAEELLAELEDLPEGVAVGGLDFIERYNLGKPMDLSGNVLIIGGGFTAIDCARGARRVLGAKNNVKIMYRRTEGQMSASPHELWQVRLEVIDMGHPHLRAPNAR